MTLPTSVTVTRRPERWYDAQIGDLYVRLAVGPDRRLDVESAPVEAQRINTAQSPEEFVDSFGQVFARSDFTGGEGLDRAHERDNDERDVSRYWDSSGVDVSEPSAGTQRKLTLLHATELTDANATTSIRLAYNGSRLYATAGTTLRVSTDPTATTPTWANESPHNGEAATTVSAVAALGTDVYAALNANGIHRYTGTWAHYNDLAADNLWAVKGRIIAASGRSIYEITAGGAAPSPLRTLAPGESWTDVCDGGGAILAAATDGYVYAFTPTGTAGALEVGGQSEVVGEQVYAIEQAQGVIIYATGEATAAGGRIGRLYRAEATADGLLTNKQLLRVWGDAATTLDRAPRTIVATRTAAVTFVRESASATHAWRYDLVNDGISRHLTFAAGGLVHGAASVGARLFAAVASSGLWRETSSFVADGWLIGPLGDFVSSADKAWVGARMDADVASGQRAVLYYTTDPAALLDPDSTAWLKVRDDDGTALADETPITGAEARYIAGMVRLYRGSDGTSPAVRSFAFRAYPTASDLIVTMPVNVSDQIEARNRRAFRVPGHGEEVFDALLDLEGSSALLTVFRPRLRIRGFVEAVGTPVPALSERGSVTYFSIVRFRGRRSTLTTTRGDGTFGVVTSAVESFGGGV